jgi:hypothetical protein
MRQDGRALVVGTPTLIMRTAGDAVHYLVATPVFMNASLAEVEAIRAALPLPEPQGNERVRVPYAMRARVVKAGDTHIIRAPKEMLASLVLALGGEEKANLLFKEYFAASGYDRVGWMDEEEPEPVRVFKFWRES